jgi:hypothetical protein
MKIGNDNRGIRKGLSNKHATLFQTRIDGYAVDIQVNDGQRWATLNGDRGMNVPSLATNTNAMRSPPGGNCSLIMPRSQIWQSKQGWT